jgi:LacI family transcriptional regulator
VTVSRRNLTILDVANAAGVSTATVSRALNGGKISGRAQRLVEDAVRALGYQRNTLARGLVTGKTGVVGVLVPDVLGPLYAQMARGIEDVLTPLGMQYTFVTSSRDRAREGAATRFLLEQQVDGLILIGSRLRAEDLTALVGERPAVLVQREGDAAPYPTLSLDNALGVRAALSHLFGNGHRRVVHIAGVRRDGEARAQAYEETMRAAGLASLVIPSDSTEAGGVSGGAALAAHGDVTAVFCSNDRVALGLYHALRERGVRIPEDVSVVGFDDLPWGEYLAPPLTTVRQPGRAMGQLAARLLLGEATADVRPVEPELVVRASVGRPKGGETTASA